MRNVRETLSLPTHSTRHVGLDTVELILSVEESFEIEISNGAAEKIQTVGDLHEFVLSELMRLERPDINREIVFDILRNLICFQLGTKPEEVVPRAHFIKDLHAD